MLRHIDRDDGGQNAGSNPSFSAKSSPLFVLSRVFLVIRNWYWTNVLSYTMNFVPVTL